MKGKNRKENSKNKSKFKADHKVERSSYAAKLWPEWNPRTCRLLSLNPHPGQRKINLSPEREGAATAPSTLNDPLGHGEIVFSFKWLESQLQRYSGWLAGKFRHEKNRILVGAAIKRGKKCLGCFRIVREVKIANCTRISPKLVHTVIFFLDFEKVLTMHCSMSTLWFFISHKD